MPSPASRRPNPSRIQDGSDAAHISDASFADSLDDRQGIGSEQLRILGLSLSAKRSRFCWIALIPQANSSSLLGRQGRACPLCNEPAFLLGQCSIEVQHERIGIDAQLGNDEWQMLSNKGDIAHVARKPASLGFLRTLR